MNKKWDEFSEQFIRENADKYTDKAGAMLLSQIIGRPISMYAWRKKRQEMGIAKANGRGVCKVVSNVINNTEEEKGGQNETA